VSCFRVASIFWFFLAAVCSSAQNGLSVTVRVIYVTTGAPAPQRMIFIERVNPDTHSPIVEGEMPLKGKTDINGRVSFPAEPLRSYQAPKTADKDKEESGTRERLSKYLDIEITYASGGIQCSPGMFSLDEILSTGTVDDNRCKSKVATSKFKSAPGEVIFVGKYHWWESGQT
jgi:hypothetical protein